MAYDDFLVDKRVVERNIKKGLVEPEELKRQIEALPDRESNLVHVSLDGSAPSDSSDEAEIADDLDDDEDDDAEQGSDDEPEAPSGEPML